MQDEETTEPTREQIEEWITQLEGLLRGFAPESGWETLLVVYRMALRTLDAEEDLDRARKLHASFPGSPLASEVIDGQARKLEEMASQLAAMTERAERAEAKLAETIRLSDHHRAYESIRVDRLIGERDVARAKLADAERRIGEVERERDEDQKALGEVSCLLAHATDRLTEVERERDVARSVLNNIVSELRDALGGFPMIGEKWTDAVKRLRAKLADAERRIAELSPPTVPTSDERLVALAENPTTHTRCEAIFQRKRADWWRDQAKRLGCTPDYPELREDLPSDERLDYESSSLLLLSTWARRVMMRPKNRAKGVPSESIRTLLWMARDELFEAYGAIEEDAPTDDILAELGYAAAYIAFAMREIEKRRKA